MARLLPATIAAVVLVAVAPAGSASGASSATLVIRPGVAIGKVRLGMTIPEVRRVLGRPQLLVRREDRGFGYRYAEYQWDYGSWRVGFGGRAGKQRAVRIGTSLVSQRTPARVGPGSNTTALARRYGERLSCVTRNLYRPDGGTWLVLRGPARAMTAFRLTKANGNGYGPHVPPAVAEVVVQRAWATGGTARCSGDWRQWRW